MADSQLEEREVWSLLRGQLEWHEWPNIAAPEVKITRTLSCHMSIGPISTLKVEQWPPKISMQLIPQKLMFSSVRPLLRSSERVGFQFLEWDNDPESVKALKKILPDGFVSCVHFPTDVPCGVRILMLLYSRRKRSFTGFIPKDQSGFINQFGPLLMTTLGKDQTDRLHRQLALVQLQWKGQLEWHERPKTAGPEVKITHTHTCHVTVGPNNALRVEQWPPKIVMQLLPQQLLAEPSLNALLRNSQQVGFQFPEQGNDPESMQALMRVTQNGFAGCVHFPSDVPRDIRILMLLYSKNKGAFIGFIPNDQSGFINKFKLVVTRHKKNQADRARRQVEEVQPGVPAHEPQQQE